MTIRPLDVERLRDEFRTAQPFPHVAIEGFLEDDFAREVAASYPAFEDANRIGHQFKAVNEYRKIQVTDASKFPDPVGRLNRALAEPRFLAQLETITGVDKLLYDDQLAGGGIHMTGSRGRLDVHVDFNFLADRGLYRRLNLLLYLNPEWERTWGGAVELWDEAVRTRYHAFAPRLNRCVIFETSDHSFHGVEEVRCPPRMTRNSFACYYYTKEPPADYVGVNHSTIFKARPDEHLKRYVLMPAERAKQSLMDARGQVREARDKLKKLLRG
ncbi:MAG: 2OG-Fe(II) oxygenase [Sandaracinaceae bacterium]